jgi:hypothetical protein
MKVWAGLILAESAITSQGSDSVPLWVMQKTCQIHGRAAERKNSAAWRLLFGYLSNHFRPRSTLDRLGDGGGRGGGHRGLLRGFGDAIGFALRGR